MVGDSGVLQAAPGASRPDRNHQLLVISKQSTNCRRGFLFPTRPFAFQCMSLAWFIDTSLMPCASTLLPALLRCVARAAGGCVYSLLSQTAHNVALQRYALTYTIEMPTVCSRVLVFR